MVALQLATHNAAALWTALAEVRGHRLVRRPGLLVVAGGPQLRILLQSANPAPSALADAAVFVREQPGALVVEDPFSNNDFSPLGLTPRQLPVMIRQSGPVPPPPAVSVTPVTRVEQLAVAEQIMVEGFPLTEFQPYRPGEAFPPGLLERPEVRGFLAASDGEPVGACLTVNDGAVGGLYWVTTLPEFRSKGVARGLMHALLARLRHLPITLTASKAGKPLYDSLGFATIGESTWWTRPG